MKDDDDMLHRIEAKLDSLLDAIRATPNKQKYLSAKEVAQLTGLDHRTILNRSNLPPDDPRHIPSLRFGSRRKYFEAKVVDRLFKLARKDSS